MTYHYLTPTLGDKFERIWRNRNLTCHGVISPEEPSHLSSPRSKCSPWTFALPISSPARVAHACTFTQHIWWTQCERETRESKMQWEDLAERMVVNQSIETSIGMMDEFNKNDISGYWRLIKPKWWWETNPMQG